MDFWLDGWKFTKIPHVIFETAGQLFFKLCITLQCHWNFAWLQCLLYLLCLQYLLRLLQCLHCMSNIFNVFCTIVAEKLYGFYKRAHHSAKFQTFDCSGEISPNLYFDRLLLLKVYKVLAKKSMEHTKKWCKIWRKTYFLFQKWQEFGEFWSEH